ncbi:MAG: ISAs1 family transposase [Trueperaceae bacterium]
MVTSIIEHFKELPDPRRNQHLVLHKVIDIIVIALCATLAQQDTWEEIADYAEMKVDFLKQFLDLPHGIPSHDTIRRVFSLIDPVAWQVCFAAWMRAMGKLSRTKLVAIDGKTLRGSKATGTGKREKELAALELVTAWASENELVLAQLAVKDGSNDITILPELLALLDLDGTTVTIDAIGIQKDVAEQIILQGGDYLLALKSNHGKIYDEATWLFSYNLEQHVPMAHAETFDVKHGRQETRTCYLMKDFSYLQTTDCNLTAWKNLAAIVVVESTTLRQDKEQTARRFFLTSLREDAATLLERVRKHWSIENQQHYPLDVTFNEDKNRTRKGVAAQNLAALRRLALNLLSLDDDKKRSKRRKRLKALLDDSYLLHLLGIPLQT